MLTSEFSLTAASVFALFRDTLHSLRAFLAGPEDPVPSPPPVKSDAGNPASLRVRLDFFFLVLSVVTPGDLSLVDDELALLLVVESVMATASSYARQNIQLSNYMPLKVVVKI